MLVRVLVQSFMVILIALCCKDFEREFTLREGIKGCQPLIVYEFAHVAKLPNNQTSANDSQRSFEIIVRNHPLRFCSHFIGYYLIAICPLGIYVYHRGWVSMIYGEYADLIQTTKHCFERITMKNLPCVSAFLILTKAWHFRTLSGILSAKKY